MVTVVKHQWKKLVQVSTYLKAAIIYSPLIINFLLSFVVNKAEMQLDIVQDFNKFKLTASPMIVTKHGL